MGKAPIVASGTLAALALWACRPTGVGDPCNPEVEPDGGFLMADTVVETHSIQCRSRICMTYRRASFCTRRCETDDDCLADWYEEGPGQGDQAPAYCEAVVGVGAPEVVGRYCVPQRASGGELP
jgi:hypothetical protein